MGRFLRVVRNGACVETQVCLFGECPKRTERFIQRGSLRSKKAMQFGEEHTAVLCLYLRNTIVEPVAHPGLEKLYR